MYIVIIHLGSSNWHESAILKNTFKPMSRLLVGPLSVRVIEINFNDSESRAENVIKIEINRTLETYLLN